MTMNAAIKMTTVRSGLPMVNAKEIPFSWLILLITVALVERAAGFVDVKAALWRCPSHSGASLSTSWIKLGLFIH